MDDDTTSVIGAEPIGASELVGYQKDSIVSRQIIKRNACNITAFAFDQGEHLSEQTALFDAVAHVIEGEAAITAGGVTYSVQGGEVVLLRAHRPYSILAVTRLKLLTTTIS